MFVSEGDTKGLCSSFHLLNVEWGGKSRPKLGDVPVLKEPKDKAAPPCSGVLPPDTDFPTVEAVVSETTFSCIGTGKGDPEQPKANVVVFVLLEIAGT